MELLYHTQLSARSMHYKWSECHEKSWTQRFSMISWMLPSRKGRDGLLGHVPSLSHYVGSHHSLLPNHLQLGPVNFNKAATWTGDWHSPNVSGILWWIGDLLSLTFIVFQLETLDGRFLLIALSLIMSEQPTSMNSTPCHGTGMCRMECRLGQLGSMRAASGSMGERRGWFSVGTSQVCIGRDFSNPSWTNCAFQSASRSLKEK